MIQVIQEAHVVAEFSHPDDFLRWKAEFEPGLFPSEVRYNGRRLASFDDLPQPSSAG